MARHKKATEVTLLPLAERSPFQEHLHRHWIKYAALGLAVSAGVIVKVVRDERDASERSAQWGQLGEEVAFGWRNLKFLPASGALTAADGGELDGSRIRQAAEQLEETSVGPWARLIAASSLADQGDYAEAEAVLDELEARFADHMLVKTPRNFEPGSGMQTALEHLRARVRAVLAWEEAHPSLIRNPAPPDGGQRVALQTSQGEIEIGLYTEQAPEHAANFLKLCSEGFFEGTRFHRVLSGRLIQGGDPNSKQDDRSTWGQGALDYTLPSEVDPGLNHFKGALAAAKKTGESDSSGCQFYILSSDNHQFDGSYTVFGQVLSGQDVVDRLAAVEVEGETPTDPVSIDSITLR